MHARAVAEFKAVSKHRAVVAEFEASKQGSRRGSTESDQVRPAAASDSEPVSPVCQHNNCFLTKQLCSLQTTQIRTDTLRLPEQQCATKSDNGDASLDGCRAVPEYCYVDVSAGRRTTCRCCKACKGPDEAPQLPGALHDGAQPR